MINEGKKLKNWKNLSKRNIGQAKLTGNLQFIFFSQIFLKSFKSQVFDDNYFSASLLITFSFS